MSQGYKYIYELYNYLEEGNYNRFLSSYWLKRPFLSESDKQRLLVKIIEGCYNDKDYKVYKHIFYPFIFDNVSFNFSVDDWVPNFLSLLIDKAPYKNLFHFFIRKGADINYVGDLFANDEDTYEELKKTHDCPVLRYETCLDFVQKKLDYLMSDDCVYGEGETSNVVKDENDKIISYTITFKDVSEQDEYHSDLIKTIRLKDFIISLGGKTYEELKCL